MLLPEQSVVGFIRDCQPIMTFTSNIGDYIAGILARSLILNLLLCRLSRECSCAYDSTLNRMFVRHSRKQALSLLAKSKLFGQLSEFLRVSYCKYIISRFFNLFLSSVLYGFRQFASALFTEPPASYQLFCHCAWARAYSWLIFGFFFSLLRKVLLFKRFLFLKSTFPPVEKIYVHIVFFSTPNILEIQPLLQSNQ